MKGINFKSIGICLFIAGAIIGIVYLYMNKKVPDPDAKSSLYSSDLKVSNREEAISTGEGAWWLTESGKKARIIK